MSFVVNIYSN